MNALRKWVRTPVHYTRPSPAHLVSVSGRRWSSCLPVVSQPSLQRLDPTRRGSALRCWTPPVLRRVQTGAFNPQASRGRGERKGGGRGEKGLSPHGATRSISRKKQSSPTVDDASPGAENISSVAGVVIFEPAEGERRRVSGGGINPSQFLFLFLDARLHSSQSVRGEGGGEKKEPAGSFI